MSETDQKSEDFAALLAEFEREAGAPKRGRGPRPGTTVKGRIVSIGAEAVFVDLGGKSEGTIAITEVRDAETGKLTVAEGEEIEAVVVENDENGVVLRRQIGRGAGQRGELAQAFEHGIPVEGLVTAVNKGGVEVTVAGGRAFCPISQLDLRHVEDAAPFIGQRLLFRITRYEPGTRGRDNVVVSRRALLEDEQREKAVATRALLKPGAVLRGTVASLKDYGAFIDLGGLEGMLHVSEIGFARVGHPKEVLSVGQSVEVQVLRIEKSDDPPRRGGTALPGRPFAGGAEPSQGSAQKRKPEKIALSLKSLEKDPWVDAVERFPEGSRVPGKVARVETFGAFVELAPGIEGLVHVSELGKNVKHARQAVKPGDPVEVTVLGVDRERRRISLSLGGAATGEPGETYVPPAPPQRLGTFGDLLKGSGKQQKKK